MNNVKKPRGGNQKKAPTGYYTASEAAARLNMRVGTFSSYVRKGKVKKYIPPMKTEGYYSKREIDRLAFETEMFLLLAGDDTPTETRTAHNDDAYGVVGVLESFGWKTATAEQRQGWYTVNPEQDYIVLWRGTVVGYIWAAPLRSDALEAMMHGSKRGWDITPDDILPFEPGRSYDLYIGIATRQDLPSHTRFASRLIIGYVSFLEELARRGIRINKLHAVSAEPDGQELSRKLGFIEQEAKEGDLFPRFLLDFQTSDSRFAKLYRSKTRRLPSQSS